MEYQVPQFIEVEDKLIGPLTLRQFIYIAGAGGLCIVFFSYISNLVIAILLSVPVVALAAALAFYKVNGKPFIEILEAGFNYLRGAKLLIWKQGDAAALQKRAEVAAAAAAAAPPDRRGSTRLTRGKLSELAWSLDVKSDDADAPSRHA